MYTLYYKSGACSMAIHVLLNELGQQFKLEEQREALLKVNPRGSVPVLADGDQIIREGAAIILHLTEKHPTSLLPKSGKERDVALEWLMFCNATLHPAYGKAFFALKAFTGDVQHEVLTAAIEQINNLWTDVEAQLAKTPYLCGKECTAADILLTVIGNWASYLPNPIQIGPNTKRLFKSVISRPAYHKALQTEKVEYKADA